MLPDLMRPLGVGIPQKMHGTLESGRPDENVTMTII
jgi:hypothetical protein